MSPGLAAIRAAQTPFKIRQQRVPRATPPEHLMAQHHLAIARDAPCLHDVPRPEIFEPEGGARGKAFLSSLVVLEMFWHIPQDKTVAG
jgi:hypothetical protein